MELSLVYEVTLATHYFCARMADDEESVPEVHTDDEDNNATTPYIDWKKGVDLPEWVIEADSEVHPSEAWILEITESGNPSGRITLDRCANIRIQNDISKINENNHITFII